MEQPQPPPTFTHTHPYLVYLVKLVLEEHSFHVSETSMEFIVGLDNHLKMCTSATHMHQYELDIPEATVHLCIPPWSDLVHYVRYL